MRNSRKLKSFNQCVWTTFKCRLGSGLFVYVDKMREMRVKIDMLAGGASVLGWLATRHKN